MKKNQIAIITIVIITIILITTLTYAFFNANPVGGNSTTNTIVTLTASYGDIIITYDNSNGVISADNIDLKESEKGIDKKYLLKFNIESTATINQDITIKWKELTNTFCQYELNGNCTNNSSDNFVGDEINYNLYICSENNYNNATTSNVNDNCVSIGNNPIPETSNIEEITTNTYLTLEPISKTYYVLLVTLQNKEIEQNYNQGKSFIGQIDVQRYSPKILLIDEILNAHPPLADNISSTYVTSASGIDFSAVSSPTNGQGLYINNKANVAGDSTIGTIKYFRGGTYCLLNNLAIDAKTKCTSVGGTWANYHCSLSDSESACTTAGGTFYELKNNVMFAGFAWKIVRINTDGSIRMIYNGPSPTSRGTNAQIGIYNYNLVSLYDTGSGPSNSSEIPTALEYASYDNGALETGIHNWYTTNLISYNDYLADSGFCSDITYTEGTEWAFGPYTRISTNKTPTFNCAQTSDNYTVANNKLNSQIATITADEMSYAGGKITSANYTYYLMTGENFWTMSPERWYSSGSVYAWYAAGLGGLIATQVSSSYGGRPVINLKADTLIIRGTGSLDNPWIIQ